MKKGKGKFQPPYGSYLGSSKVQHIITGPIGVAKSYHYPCFTDIALRRSAVFSLFDFLFSLTGIKVINQKIKYECKGMIKSSPCPGKKPDVIHNHVTQENAEKRGNRFSGK